MENNDLLEQVLNEVKSADYEKVLAFNTILKVEDNEDILNFFINESTPILKKYYNETIIENEEFNIVLFTLAWITFNHYDGNFWDAVRDSFAPLYEDIGNDQRLENKIRSLVSRQDKYSDSRHVTHVIVHAGIPRNFLLDFFDLMFDIYKINFNSYVGDDESLYEILLDTIIGIYPLLSDKNTLDSDELSVNVTKKTYKLIKYTKLGILTYLDSYMAIMKMVMYLIDAWNWNYYLETDLPKVLVDKFNDWVKERDPKRTNDISRSDYISKPTLRLSEDAKSVYAVFSDFRLRNFDPQKVDDVTVQYIDENTSRFLDKSEFKIIEQVGYYKVDINPYKIENPFIKPQFIIKYGEEEIGNTGDKLYRTYILFNKARKEIQNMREYSDLVYIVYPTDQVFRGEGINVPISYEFYKMNIFSANPQLVYYLDDEIICFTNKINVGVYGEKIDGLTGYINNSQVDVYKKIDRIVFAHIASIEQLSLKINGHIHELDSFNVNYIKNGSFYYYNLVFEDGFFRSNIYSVSLLSKVEKYENLKTEKFIVDNDFTIKFDDTLNKLIKNIDLRSSFKPVSRKYNFYDFRVNTYFTIPFKIGFNELIYEINPFIRRYKWDVNEQWNLLEDLEIGDHKYLYVASKKSTLKLYNSNYNVLPDPLKSEKEDNYSKFELLPLIDFKNNNKYLYFRIEEEGQISSLYRLYLQQLVVAHTVKLELNNRVKFIFDIKNFIPNTLDLYILKNGKEVQHIALIDPFIMINNIALFKKYDFKINQRPNILLGLNKQILYKFTYVYSDATKLSGHVFKVRTGYINNSKTKDDVRVSLRNENELKVKFKHRVKAVPYEYSSFNGNNKLIYECELYRLNKLRDYRRVDPNNPHYILINSRRDEPIISFEIEDINGEGGMELFDDVTFPNVPKYDLYALYFEIDIERDLL